MTATRPVVRCSSHPNRAGCYNRRSSWRALLHLYPPAAKQFGEPFLVEHLRRLILGGGFPLLAGAGQARPAGHTTWAPSRGGSANPASRDPVRLLPDPAGPAPGRLPDLRRRALRQVLDLMRGAREPLGGLPVVDRHGVRETPLHNRRSSQATAIPRYSRAGGNPDHRAAAWTPARAGVRAEATGGIAFRPIRLSPASRRPCPESRAAGG